MNPKMNVDTTEKSPGRPEGDRTPSMIDPPSPGGPAGSPTQKPSETPREPNELPGSPPREVPRQPLPTERDRERAENEGMIPR